MITDIFARSWMKSKNLLSLLVCTISPIRTDHGRLSLAVARCFCSTVVVCDLQ